MSSPPAPAADTDQNPSSPPAEPTTPLLSGLSRNTIAQFLARAVGIVAQGIALILVARHLGPAGYGPFALVSTLTMMATVVADWGLVLVGARAVARRPDDERRILGACLSLRLMLGVVAIGLLVGLSFVGSSSSRVHVAAAVAGLSFIPGAWLAVGNIVAQVELRLERVAIPLVLGSLASMAWMLGVLEFGGGLVALSASFTVASVVSAGACMATLHGRLPLRPRRDTALWQQLLRESTPVGLSLVFVTVYFYVDALLLARLSTTEQLGLYDSAYRFVQLGPLIPGILVSSVFVLAAGYAAHDRERLRLFVREFTSVIALLVPVPLLLLATEPHDLITLLYGPAYEEAAPVLAILAVAVALMIFSGVVGPMLVALGRERWTMLISAAAAVLNIAMNVALIPILDAQGAALATVFTEVAVLATAAVLLQRELHVRLDGVQLLKVTAAALIAAAAIELLPGHVVFRLVAGFVIYLVLLVASSAASRRQLDLMRTATPAPRGVG